MGYKRIVKLKTKIQRRDERIAQLERSKKSMQEKVIYLDGEAASLRALIDEKNEKIDLLYKEVGDMGARIAANTDSFAKNGVARIQTMIADLDTTLHGKTVARDQPPKEVWESLLGEVKILNDKAKEFVAENIDLRNTIIQRDAEIKKVEIECYRLIQANTKLKQDLKYADVELSQFKEDAANRSAASLEIEITKALNFWGADTDLNTPDHILGNHLYRHLMDLKRMLEATAKWKGE